VVMFNNKCRAWLFSGVVFVKMCHTRLVQCVAIGNMHVAVSGCFLMHAIANQTVPDYF